MARIYADEPPSGPGVGVDVEAGIAEPVEARRPVLVELVRASVGNKSCSIDADWQGIRFVCRLAER